MSDAGRPLDEITERFNALIHSSEDGFYDLDLNARMAFYSPRLYEILGLEPLPNPVPLPDVLPFEHIHPDDRERVRTEFQHAMVRHKSSLVSEFRLRTGSGDYTWILTRAKVVKWNPDGSPARICGCHTDITRNRRLEQVLQAILMTVSRATGGEFFRQLALQLPATLGTRYCLIGEVEPGQPDRVRTVAVASGGEIVENFAFDMEGGAFKRLLATRVCHCSENAGCGFMSGVKPGGIDARSCLGIALKSSSGEGMGLMAVLHDAPMPHGSLWETVLTIFAARAEFELERLRVEEQLASSEGQYRQLFEQMISGFCVLEVVREEGEEVDLRFLQFNPAMQVRTGYSEEHVRGRTFRELGLLYPPELIRNIVNVAETGVPFECEFRSIIAERFMDLRAFRPAVGRVAILLHDITERKLAQEALRESDRRFRAMLETLQLASIIIAPDWTVQFCNDHLVAMLGLPREEILGVNWLENFVPEPERARMRTFASPGDGWAQCPSHFRNQVVTRTGEERLIDWDNTVLYGSDGQVSGIASIGRDLTESRAMEEKVRQSQKMEAIGRVAGGVAHDFNNLLTVISGFTRIALTQVPAGSAVERYLNGVDQAGERAASLTHQLLAFSRRQVLQPAVFGLNGVIRGLEPILHRLAGEKVRLEMSLEAGLDAILADPSQIEQVVLNLTVNAHDAMPEGGTLRIATSNVQLNGMEPPLPAGSCVLLTVSDTGLGMNEQVMARLFEPFFTTKEPGKGTGLGLSTAYGIVQQSGGEIRVWSEPGRGSEFFIYLRCADGELAQELDGAGETEHAKPGTGSILVVEDQEDVRAFVSEVLHTLGYEVVRACSGNDALAVLEEQGRRIDLMLTDMVMPGVDGTALTKKALGLRPGLKVVFMSGYTDPEALAAEWDDAKIPFLRKPFSPGKLSQAVSAALAGRRYRVRGRQCGRFRPGREAFRGWGAVRLGRG